MAGPLKGSVIGRDAERFEVLCHRECLCDEGLLVGQAAEFVALEGLDAEEVHAIGGAGAGDDDEAGDVAGRADAGAFGGDEVVGLVRGLQADGVVEDVGVLLEEAGELAQAVLPLGLVLHQRGAAENFASTGTVALTGGSFEKSAEASSSLARTCCSVFTFR